MSTTKKTIGIQLKSHRHSTNEFKIMKITGAVFVYTMHGHGVPPMGDDGYEHHVGEVITKKEAIDLSEQERYLVTVVA